MFDLILLPLIPLAVAIGIVGAVRIEASDAMTPTRRPGVEPEAST